MGKIIIDTDVCFECGKPSGEMHHVIPRVRGGTKTIPLCVECHCKVHDLKNRPDHKKLVIEGLKKAKERGVKLGTPANLTESGKKKGIEVIKQKAINNEANIQSTALIVEYRAKGYSYDKIANYLNENDYTTANGKYHNSTSVIRLYNRYLENLII